MTSHVNVNEDTYAYTDRQYVGLCFSTTVPASTLAAIPAAKLRNQHGNPRLRAALVELAWRLVRFQPNYHPVRKCADPGQRRTATGAARKKAIVAVARQLAVDLWRIKTAGSVQKS